MAVEVAHGGRLAQFCRLRTEPAEAALPDIKLIAPGASAADIARGEAAAQAIFDASGVPAKEAAVAGFRLEIAERGWNAEMPAGEEPFGLREGEFDAAMVWMEACDAAFMACTGGPRPFGWSFQLVTEREES